MIAPAMFTGDDVTWYVPCYNAHATLSRCLHGITQQCTRPARVLVIDDGSHDSYGTLPVEVIRHKSNAGLAAARNTALAACRTPLLAAVDADVAVEPDWLRRMLDTLNDTRAAGAGGCLREHYDDTPADSWRARHMAQHWGQAPLRNPRFLFGSNTLFVADALRAIGGYDTRWRTNGEDIAVSEAVYATGRALAYAPDAVGRHLRQDTIRTVLRGFWQWHHVAGVRNRDFDTLETLVDRIERVGIGIWRFRAARDEREGCTDLLPLDAALPWIFAAC
ncbi:MAG: glycosyltransferase, partial [Phycisphaerales bacterium]|nr:glycosyltransferase [Phycisphaerales bacterium]